MLLMIDRALVSVMNEEPRVDVARVLLELVLRELVLRELVLCELLLPSSEDSASSSSVVFRSR